MDTRLITPALFSLLFVLLIGGYAAVFLLVDIPLVVKVAVGAVALALAATMVYVLNQRRVELKQEDKDDLGKY